MKKVFSKSVFLLLALCIACSAFLCACDNKTVPQNFPVAISPADRSALELCSTPRTNADLDKIYSFVNDSGNSINDLNKKYEIQCLRQDEDEYRIEYIGGNHILVLRFDKDAKYIKDEKLNSLYRVTDTRGKFDKLKVGDPVTEVQKVDPSCYFPFLLDPSTDRHVTYHYTEDGYCTKIKYDTDMKISEISHALM